MDLAGRFFSNEMNHSRYMLKYRRYYIYYGVQKRIENLIFRDKIDIGFESSKRPTFLYTIYPFLLVAYAPLGRMRKQRDDQSWV